MKMTREQVADLLLKANEDFSNVERKHQTEPKWVDNEISKEEVILYKIAVYGYEFRIKDNVVEEVTLDLKGKWAKNITSGDYHPIDGLRLGQQKILIHGTWLTTQVFNERWKIVEDNSYSEDHEQRRRNCSKINLFTFYKD